MDPMDIEEDMRRREEEQQRDLEDTIGLIDFITRKNLHDRGREVNPTTKQINAINSLAQTLVNRDTLRQLSRRKSMGDVQGSSAHMETDSAAEFDVLSRKRVIITEGAVNKREPDGILWKIQRRHLILFNDALLITNKRESKNSVAAGDTFELHQVILLQDMRVSDLSHEEDEDPTALEIIVQNRSQRQASSIIFLCDTAANKKSWLTEITNTLLAYHANTPLARSRLGWYHEVILGTIHSAALLGDIGALRKHLKLLEKKGSSPDIADESGMYPIHWTVLRGHEACLRVLLEKGADIDSLNAGLNTPLLLAAARGYDNIARLLIEKGADLQLRNLKDRNAVFMAVVYGHASKGLPWTLQMLNAKGMDLDQVDTMGATPLHLCAERNLARPVRMLVDAGADVNVKHQRTQLTPLQMACNQPKPDVETIRSFLDKGAYPNWRDVQGRTAFEFIMQQNYVQRRVQFDGNSPAVIGDAPPEKLSPEDDPKWRNMEGTLKKVGDWAVYALPVLLEIARKGGRFDPKCLDSLRTSFRAAVLEARDTWNQKKEPSNFMEFIVAREQAGEDIRMMKNGWQKDDASSACQLCAEAFSLKNRRHHCRACGCLTCESCSTKRLTLSAIEESSSKDSSSDRRQRVCDGCFNRLMHEASQPSPDHFRVRQLKFCALELMDCLGELIEALDDPAGDPMGIHAALSTAVSVQLSDGTSQSSVDMGKGGRRDITPVKSARLTPQNSQRSSTPRPGEGHIDAIRRRVEKLSKTENLCSKFLESADGYHRIAKKLIEQKMNSNRLWGMQR